MYGKKELLAKALSRIGCIRLMAGMRSYLVNDVRIIAYHRICDTDSLNNKGLVSANSEVFEKQVLHIKQHYNPITFGTLISVLEQGRKLEDSSVIITFDDGFFDNYKNAFPILSRHGVPATFFISTDYIGTEQTFWFNLVSRMICSSAGKTFRIDGQVYSITIEATRQEDMLLDEVLQKLKNRSNDERKQLIVELVQQLDYKDQCDPLALPMNWQHVSEMSQAGMEFGSHSASHPILSRLTPQELSYEILDSKQQLEKQLGLEIQAIAYPEGMEYAFNSQVIDEVTRAGYKMGASYISGVNKMSALQMFQLKRMHIEHYTSYALFCSMLACPEIFA